MAGRICVPLDGTEYAEYALPLATDIARRSGMPVTLLTVINPDDLGMVLTAGEGIPSSSDFTTRGSAGMHMAGEGTGGLTGMVWATPLGSPKDLSKDEAAAIDQANKQARSYLAAVESQVAEKGVRVNVVLGYGNPDSEIVDEAVRSGSTMIVMTGRSKSFWERGVLGSTADRVVNGSPMPVLVFKPMRGVEDAVAMTPGAVVIGLDGSQQAEQGLKPAVELAKAVGAQVRLVRVVKGGGESRRKEAEEYLAKVASRAGVDAATEVRHGDPDVEVILSADEFDYPLIAVTEHGERSFGKWFRGSTTDKIIRNAGYPVLVSPVVSD